MKNQNTPTRLQQIIGLGITAQREPTAENIAELAKVALSFGLMHADDAALCICWITGRVRDLTDDDLAELSAATMPEARRRGVIAASEDRATDTCPQRARRRLGPSKVNLLTHPRVEKSSVDTHKANIKHPKKDTYRGSAGWVVKSMVPPMV